MNIYSYFVYTLHHILSHKHYKRGNRALWIIVAIIGMNFIGKNGVGKTTTMKIILGLLKPDSGEIFVSGDKVRYGQTSTNRYIGYLPDVPEFYSFMTSREYLKLCGESLEMEKADMQERSEELLSLVGLSEENYRMKGFSRGMKQRLGIAQALLGRPKTLICDEPTSALDPIGRKEILDILLTAKEQTTVLFSTHILSDIERICTDVAFFKKEILECARTGKLTILCSLFLLFGIMNPAIVKLIPWLSEIMSDSLAENGMIVTGITIDALTSWTQFFKNIPIALTVFVLIYSGIFAKEYESGTLILILTKGLSRYKVVLYFWDNSIAVGLMPAAIHWWLFGIWIVCLIVLFSALCKKYAGVLLGTGGSILGLYLIGLLPKTGRFIPTVLMNNSSLLIGAESADVYRSAIIITVLVSVSSLILILSIAIMNKKQL